MSAPSLVWDVTEEALRRSVLTEAEARGWEWHPGAGTLPDLFLVRGPRLLCVELKTERAQPRRGVVDWLAALDRVTEVEAHLWAPSDKADGKVTAALMRRGTSG